MVKNVTGGTNQAELTQAMATYNQVKVTAGDPKALKADDKALGEALAGGTKKADTGDTVNITKKPDAAPVKEEKAADKPAEEAPAKDAPKAEDDQAEDEDKGAKAGKGKGHGKGHGLGNGGLPPGIAKKDHLPPGLAKKLDKFSGLKDFKGADDKNKAEDAPAENKPADAPAGNDMAGLLQGALGQIFGLLQGDKKPAAEPAPADKPADAPADKPAEAPILKD